MSPAAALAERVHRQVVHVMGMPVSLALRGAQAQGPAADRAWAAVVAELQEVDATFSTYRPGSVVSRLARGELAEADCPPEVAEVLALGRAAEAESDGAFSIMLPGPDGRPRLDPSGVVKGWAVERAARHLAGLAGTDHCLSAGGDLVCSVADPGRPAWQVGIEDPRDPSRVVAVVPVRSGAVATSGTAHRGSHLVDARTGTAPTGVASVTVVGRSLTQVDIDATAAYARGAGAAAWLRSRPGRTGLVVRPDGSTELVGPTTA